MSEYIGVYRRGESFLASLDEEWGCYKYRSTEAIDAALWRDWMLRMNRSDYSRAELNFSDSGFESLWKEKGDEIQSVVRLRSPEPRERYYLLRFLLDEKEFDLINSLSAKEKRSIIFSASEFADQAYVPDLEPFSLYLPPKIVDQMEALSTADHRRFVVRAGLNSAVPSSLKSGDSIPTQTGKRENMELLQLRLPEDLLQLMRSLMPDDQREVIRRGLTHKKEYRERIPWKIKISRVAGDSLDENFLPAKGQRTELLEKRSSMLSMAIQAHFAKLNNFDNA